MVSGFIALSTSSGLLIVPNTCHDDSWKSGMLIFHFFTPCFFAFIGFAIGVPAFLHVVNSPVDQNNLVWDVNC